MRIVGVLRAVIGWTVVAGLFGGCAAPLANSVWQNRLRAAQIRSVAVLPLENLTADGYAADVVAGQLSSALYGSGRFLVIEKNEALRKLEAAKVGLPAVIDARAAVEAGRALQVDGVMIGTVTEYAYLFYPEDAVFGVRLDLVDVESGAVVWTGFYSHRNQGLLQGDDEPITGLVKEGLRTLVAQLSPPPAAAQ